MRKLLVVLATLGLMFNVIGCKAKKAQDDTEIIENADVEKIEAEDANFAGNESIESGPVDESLQAALGETPTVEGQVSSELTADPSTEIVQTDIPGSTPGEISGDDLSLTPSVDENSIASTPLDTTIPGTEVDAGITETPVVASITDSSTITETDSTLVPDTSISSNENSSTETTIIETPVAQNSLAASSVSETAISETPITETPITEAPAETTTTITETPVEKVVKRETRVSKVVESSSTASVSSNKNKLQKIADAVPYAFGDGFVNTVYIARPKEKLADISMTIYGSDKSSELKQINTFLKSRSPKAGEKIYYTSPNRPTDSSRTISFYEDTGMASMTYTAEKSENLTKVAKKLLGYDKAWQEVWTTNGIESKTKLAQGDTIRYWKPVEQVSAPITLANLDGQAKLIDSTQQMPAQNTPPPPQEMAQNQMPSQELPPAPPAPEPQMDQTLAQNAPPPPQEMTPPPVEQPVAQELPPPPPPPQPVAEQPVAAAAAPSMEEEGVAEEGGLSSDLTMQLGAVAVLVALLGFVFIRRNKKKKEAEFNAVEQTHVGT